MAGSKVSVDRKRLANLFAAIDDVLQQGQGTIYLAKLKQAASAVCQDVGKVKDGKQS